MTAKEFLNQGYQIDVMINAKVEQIASLRSLLTKLSVTMSDMPKSPNKGGSKVEDTVIRIVTLEEEINKDIDWMLRIKDRIRRTIEAVPNRQEKMLLTLRYLNFMTWERIASEMRCSVRNVHIIHGRALENIKIPRE